MSTVSRIGRFVWNRTTTVKDPLSGRMKQVERPKQEQSALALRRLTGLVTLNPETPDVGRPYFLRVSCKFDSLNLLAVADGGSTSLNGGGAGN